MSAVRCFLWCLVSGLLMLAASLAFAQSTASVTLAWDDTANTGHTGYNLYRKRGQTGTFALVKTVTASDKTTTDTLPVGQIYCYVVTAYMTEGATTVESPRSNEVCTASLRAPITLRVQ